MSFRVVMAGTKLLFCVLILSVVGTAAQTGRSLRGGTAAQMDLSLQDMVKLVCQFASQKQIEDRATKAVCEVITHLMPHVVFNPDCETAAEAVWDAAVAQCPKMSCHDTKEGESCYTAVVWAMEHGAV